MGTTHNGQGDGSFVSENRGEKRNIDMVKNNEDLMTNLGLFEETRIDASLTNASKARKMARLYNKRVKERGFQVGDLVLRSCEASRPAGERKKDKREGGFWGSPFFFSFSLLLSFSG